MSGSTKLPSRDYFFLFFFVILKIVLEYIVVNPAYELQRDEYFYLDQSNHLAAGYVSVPPITSWIGVIVHLAGNSLFAARFFPAFYGAITLIVCWQIVKELGEGLKAQIASTILLLCSILLRLDILFQPNSFDVLAWSGIYLLLIKYVRTKESKWLLWLGAVMGIAFLNKYNVAFLLVGLIPAFLFTSQRTIFFNRYSYLGLLIAIIIVLPNFIWQVQNHFPVIHHMHELVARQLDNVSRIDFLFFQFLFFFLGDLVLLAAFVGLLFYPPFKPYRFIGLSYMFTILLFLYLRGKMYYAIGLYPALIAMGSTFLTLFFRKGWKQFILPGIVVINVGLFISVANLILPILNPEQILQNPGKFKAMGLLKWEDGKDHPLPQDFADMQGWKEMAEKTLFVYNQIPDMEKPKTLIICDNYGQAGAINYYNRGKINPAVSFNADYVSWFPKSAISTVIAVKEMQDTIEQKYIDEFQAVSIKGKVLNKSAREFGTTIYLLTGADSSFAPNFYNRAARERKFQNDFQK